MNIDEMKQKKAELARDIRMLIESFEEETGTTVNNVFLERVNVVNRSPGETTIITDVNIDVKL